VAIPFPEIVEAIGGLLRADPARTLAVADSLRAPGRTYESTVTGMSMGPWLPPGSRIRIALIPAASYEVGEVVTFVAGEQIVVHRVAHRGRAAAALGHLVTLGDATLVPDPPVATGQVLGAVTGVWRSGGWVRPAGSPRRSLPARAVRALSVALAVGALQVSPRATARVMTGLHRVAAALRTAWVRERERRSPGPPGRS